MTGSSAADISDLLTTRSGATPRGYPAAVAAARPLLPYSPDGRGSEEPGVWRALHPDLLPGQHPFANLVQRPPSCGGVEPIDEQDAVQVIRLVGEAACQALGSLDPDRLAVLIETLRDHTTRSGQLVLETWQRQASLDVLDGIGGLLDEQRVHDVAHGAVL